MANEWYYRNMSAELGPFAPSEMRQFASRGVIGPETKVRKGVTGQWVDAEQVKGLFAAQAPRPQPPMTSAPVPSAQLQPSIKSFRIAPAVQIAARESKAKRIVTLGSVGATIGLLMFVLTTYFFSGNSAAPITTSVAPTSVANSWFAPRRLTTEEVVARSEGSVALIKGKNSSGTGFLVRASIVATNDHVISDELSDSIQVHFPSAAEGSRGPVAPKVIYEDRARDLAFLYVETKLQPLNIARLYQFQRGQEIIVIGSPSAQNDLVVQNAISKGVMSTETTIRNQPYYQLGISVNPGNSGGPVLDNFGDVIGIVTLKAAKQEGLAFCIPHAEFLEALDRLKTLSARDYDVAESMHRSRAAFTRIGISATAYKTSMEQYTTLMGMAIEKGLGADSGLKVGKDGITKIIAAVSDTIGPVKDELASQISTDPNLPDSLRHKFVDFWTNYKELKSYVDNPRGSYSSYRAKCAELGDDHDRLFESLRLLLGVTKSED